MPTAIATIPTVHTARSFAAEISARAAEAEALGTMPADLVARLRRPSCSGPCSHEGSAATSSNPPASWRSWRSSHAPMARPAGRWPSARADLRSPRGWNLWSATTSSAPTPTSPRRRCSRRPDDWCRGEPGDLTLAGRWPFASGCRHAEWFITGAFVFDGDGPRIIPEQGPDWRLTYFPSGQGRVVDNWDVMGLRATGSNDLTVDELVIADEHTANPFFSPARHDGPLWRLAFFTLAGIALVGVPLGIGRRALDEITAFAPTKTRAGTFSSVAEDQNAQVDLARAEARLRGARAFVFDAAGSIWETACAGDAPSVEQRATFQLAAQGAMGAALEAVDVAFGMGGASAVRSEHPLERCFRDVHTLRQHAYFSTGALQRFAKTRFGIDQPTFMM